MALHKLLVEQFHDESYALIAIHCNLEDYRLAFLLNKHLNIKLKRCLKDLDFEYTMASYSIYEWKDENQQMTWNLVENICRKEEDALTSTGSLFQSPTKVIKTFNLIPELNKVDFFLKIDNDGNQIYEKSIIEKIHNIPQIATVYSVDSEELKSRDNLILN